MTDPIRAHPPGERLIGGDPGAHAGHRIAVVGPTKSGGLVAVRCESCGRDLAYSPGLLDRLADLDDHQAIARFVTVAEAAIDSRWQDAAGPERVHLAEAGLLVQRAKQKVRRAAEVAARENTTEGSLTREAGPTDRPSPPPAGPRPAGG